MFNGIKDMGKLLKQAQEMKSKMKTVQKELKETQIKEEHDGITIVINGEMDFEEVLINPALITAANAKKLEKLFKEASNKAIKKAKDLATSKLTQVTGGLKIPGLT